MLIVNRWTTFPNLGCLMHLDSYPVLVRDMCIEKLILTVALSVDNYPAPGKRPLSSTAPTIITQEDGTFFLALGGSGGSMIFPSILQSILNVDWGMDIRAAIEAPRVRVQPLC